MLTATQNEYNLVSGTEKRNDESWCKRMQDSEDKVLSLDAFIRSIGVKQSTPHALFLGAGASVSSGIPSAETSIWEWKRSIFLSNNPGLEEQFAELSLQSIRQRIQIWLDRQGSFPKENSPDEYGFYVERCYPIAEDRVAYFRSKIKNAEPHLGYRLICRLAEAGLFKSVWTTNFDGLVARAAANSKLAAIEVGIDTQNRLARAAASGELLCISLHGDYRYDKLKNTAKELQDEEDRLRLALLDEICKTPLVVSGYSGRDQSVMEALRAAYQREGTGILYWCGLEEGSIPSRVESLINHVREQGKQAYYVPTFGFDDLFIRLSLHCLQGSTREAAKADIVDLAPNKLLERMPFQVADYAQNTLVKSNAFEAECPSEVLAFDLESWPKEKVWSQLRETVSGKAILVVPHRGKVLALGTVDDVKAAFEGNIKGSIERTPVGPNELRHEDSAVVSLMRDAIVRCLAHGAGVSSDQSRELWLSDPVKGISQGATQCYAYESLQVFLRQIGSTQYLVLKPSIKVLDDNGEDVPSEIANPIKLGILGYQHNKQFNQAINKWRELLFPPGRATSFEFPWNCGSTFKFKIRKAPSFGQIGVPRGHPSVDISEKIRPLAKHRGFELEEPKLVFSNRTGNGTAQDVHPIRGMLNNRPFDYPLTSKGFLPSVRMGVVCPREETRILCDYLQKSQQTHTPSTSEQDYLLPYPGFQQAYGLPLELPAPGSSGWAVCQEPSHSDPSNGAIETAKSITMAIETMQASYTPQVVLVLFPARWDQFRAYRTENERFDVHDFVKAFCVQRGIASQFLNEDTFADAFQCRVWWWLSLAIYVKAMRTPWVLETVNENTAYVGLGFSIDPTADKKNHVVLGCSHIYGARGVGLQYRLSKIEDPIIRRGNPYMSRDDARRVGETIRQLFFEAHMKLPERVVLHKRTPFLKDERDGLVDGLSGLKSIDMLEIQIDGALRYVASVQGGHGSVNEDNYPVHRGTTLKLDDFTALLWNHGATTALNPRLRYYQGKRRIPAPLLIRRHAGQTDLNQAAAEVLGLSKMDWNSFDLYKKLPATLQSSNEIARIGSMLQRFGALSYDYRLFI